MKKILLALAALASITAAQAGVIASTENQAGGRIILTDDQRDCRNGMNYMFITTDEGDVLGGCWELVNTGNDNGTSGVSVIMSSGKRRLYDGIVWKFTNYGTAAGFNPNSNRQTAARGQGV